MDGQLYIGEKYRRQNFDFSFQTLESFPGCIFPQVFAGKIKFLFFFFHDPFFCRFSRRVKGRKRVENFIQRKISKGRQNFYFSFSIFLRVLAKLGEGLKEGNGWATLHGGKISKGKQNFDFFFFQTLNWNCTISKAFHDRFHLPAGFSRNSRRGIKGKGKGWATIQRGAIGTAHKLYIRGRKYPREERNGHETLMNVRNRNLHTCKKLHKVIAKYTAARKVYTIVTAYFREERDYFLISRGIEERRELKKWRQVNES